MMSSDDPNLKPAFYKVELNKTVWVIPNYYQNLTPVGTGAYGTVWYVCIRGHALCSSVPLHRHSSAAECTTTNEKVAIKKFTRPFQSPIHAKRTHRELRLLRLMSHENVIDLYDVFTPDKDGSTINDV